MAETKPLRGQRRRCRTSRQWIFAQDIPADERNRLIDDMVAAFKTVFDPEIPCDIYELGLIYKVDVDANG